MFKKVVTSLILPLVLILAACNQSSKKASTSTNSSSESKEANNTTVSDEAKSNVSAYRFEDDGTIPNNPTFSVMIYQQPFKGRTDKIIDIFKHNHWSNSWTNGVYNFQHFHSNAHEVLAIRAGHGKIQIGGEKGKIIEVSAGDVIVLPAGTGHKRIEASDDFSVIGAYPNGVSYDLQKKANNQLRENIQQVSRPDTDPVYGNEGPLLELWKK
ncbi:cupin domain-containing protein [Bacillus sp. 03113]|uniref:cupin domain-containing protein n=1 Tax=Bacillus sp. 03113 TaxID=2578211 RepID=UPI001144B8C6|nr:cupin domain-containing protein [Bacillus sp. 03113]